MEKITKADIERTLRNTNVIVATDKTRSHIRRLEYNVAGDFYYITLNGKPEWGPVTENTAIELYNG